MKDKIENWYRRHISQNIVGIFLLGAVVLTILQIIIGFLPVLSFISIILLFLTWYFYNREFSLILFICAITAFSFSSYLTILILIVIGIYLVCKLVDIHRLKRLEKLAKSSPDQIADIKKGKGRVIEIIISGNKTGGNKR